MPTDKRKRWLRRNWQVLCGLPFSIFFNLRYLPLRQALRLPILLYRPRFGALRGEVVIDTHGGGYDMAWCAWASPW